MYFVIKTTWEFYSGGEKFKIQNGSDQKGENERQWRKRQTGTQATKSFLSTHDISSIKRILTRKFVKFQVIVVQQQQQQKNVQKGVMHVQSCFFFSGTYWFLINTAVLHAVCFLLFKRDNVVHAWHFYARVAQFPRMFLIELILNTDLQTDFFAVVWSSFFV